MALGIGIAFIVVGLGALVVLRRMNQASASPAEIALAKADLVLDVRDFRDFQKGHLDNARNIPIDLVPKRFGAIEGWAGGKRSSVVVYCTSGRSAERAQRMLQGEGFAAVVNAGGYLRIKNDARP